MWYNLDADSLGIIHPYFNLHRQKSTISAYGAIHKKGENSMKKAENGTNDKKRVELNLVFVNSTPSVTNKGHSIITFEDEKGNRYEYDFAASMTNNSRNKLFRSVKPYEYIPLLQSKNSKPRVRITFTMGAGRFNPVTGRCIYQMYNPVFVSGQKVDSENAENCTKS